MNYRDSGAALSRENVALIEHPEEAQSSLLALHLSLFKVRILGGVATSALLGAFLVSPEISPIQTLLFLLVGTALSYGGAAAWNQVLEVPFDKQMERTRARPLPSGELSVRYAIGIGSLFAVLGVAVLYLCVSPVTGLLSIAAFISYVFIYTPLKRVGWYGTLVGTIPGALPAVGGAVYFEDTDFVIVTALFLLMVFWQLPHFYAYLWDVRGDYQKAGFSMLPYATPNGLYLMKRLVVLGALITALSTAVISFFSPALTIVSGSIATLGAMYLLIQSLRFASSPDSASSKRLFRSTIYFIAYFMCVAGFSFV